MAENGPKLSIFHRPFHHHSNKKYIVFTYFIYHYINLTRPNQKQLIKSGTYWIQLAKTSKNWLKINKTLNFWLTFSPLQQCLKYMVFTYFKFIIITTSSGQIKNISWSQEHLACNFEKQAIWKTSTKLKGQNSQFLIDICNTTPMLEIHGPYIFYSSWHHLHLTKSRTSYQVRNILNVTCKNKQHTWQNIGKTFSFWLAFSPSHQCFHTKCLFI